ncbi:hypothetical protein G5V59_24015 [Nocardioides sp. W3-2-3]|uniref:hypothetical protein n=1 Tax=Nocardioides convexus TaxID=2712224 RepID=UPI0024181BE9|nr:hypothetical protein [Nocardioides convexus]NHA01738.1 hypothetical protein [Nocardioides convexus]
MAQVGVTSGAELDGVVLRLMPALMLIVVPVAIAAAGMRLTGKTWAGPAAAFLAVGCGQMNALGAALVVRPIVPESPTLGLSVPMLMGLVVLLVTRWRGTALPGAWVVMVLLAVGASGTKGSATPLVVAGLGVAGLAMIVLNRARVLRIFVDGCLVVAALVVVVVTVFRGSGAGLHLSLADAADATWASHFLGTDTFVHRESLRHDGPPRRAHAGRGGAVPVRLQALARRPRAVVPAGLRARRSRRDRRVRSPRRQPGLLRHPGGAGPHAAGGPRHLGPGGPVVASPACSPSSASPRSPACSPRVARSSCWAR